MPNPNQTSDPNERVRNLASDALRRPEPTVVYTPALANGETPGALANALATEHGEAQAVASVEDGEVIFSYTAPVWTFDLGTGVDRREEPIEHTGRFYARIGEQGTSSLVVVDQSDAAADGVHLPTVGVWYDYQPVEEAGAPPSPLRRVLLTDQTQGMLLDQSKAPAPGEVPADPRTTMEKAEWRKWEYQWSEVAKDSHNVSAVKPFIDPSDPEGQRRTLYSPLHSAAALSWWSVAPQELVSRTAADINAAVATSLEQAARGEMFFRASEVDEMGRQALLWTFSTDNGILVYKMIIDTTTGKVLKYLNVVTELWANPRDQLVMTRLQGYSVNTYDQDDETLRKRAAIEDTWIESTGIQGEAGTRYFGRMAIQYGSRPYIFNGMRIIDIPVYDVTAWLYAGSDETGEHQYGPKPVGFEFERDVLLPTVTTREALGNIPGQTVEDVDDAGAKVDASELPAGAEFIRKYDPGSRRGENILVLRERVVVPGRGGHCEVVSATAVPRPQL